MPKLLRPSNSTVLLDIARGLRATSTDAEVEQWFHLRASRLNGMKFRRQHPIHPFVVDFYCESAKLVVELDGSQHNELVDATRTKFLESRGLKVLRVWDNGVLM